MSCLGVGLPSAYSWQAAERSPQNWGIPHPQLGNGIPRFTLFILHHSPEGMKAASFLTLLQDYEVHEGEVHGWPKITQRASTSKRGFEPEFPKSYFEAVSTTFPLHRMAAIEQ